MRGWALAVQGHSAVGIAQIRQGIAAWRASGGELWVPYYGTLLADVYAHLGHWYSAFGFLVPAVLVVLWIRFQARLTSSLGRSRT